MFVVQLIGPETWRLFINYLGRYFPTVKLVFQKAYEHKQTIFYLALLVPFYFLREF